MTFGGDLFYFITIFEISAEFSMARMTEITTFFRSVVRSINFHNGKCAFVSSAAMVAVAAMVRIAKPKNDGGY